MSTVATALAVLAVLLAWPVPALLARAHWPERDPVVALLAWQSIGLAGALSLIGAPLVYGLGPWGASLPTATLSLLTGAGYPNPGPRQLVALVLATVITVRLVTVLIRSTVTIARVRARQRELLATVTRPAGDRRTQVVDVADVVAFCIPGSQPMIVLSRGLITELDDAETAAVIAHENAHLTEHHHLYLLPFVAWRQAFPWLPGTNRAYTAVHDLVEMHADDLAARSAGRDTLARALARTGSAQVPFGSLGVQTGPTTTRVTRLLQDPQPLPTWERFLVLASAAALLLLPTGVLLLAES
jgi:Zn-dependent protease with chaperone function